MKSLRRIFAIVVLAACSSASARIVIPVAIVGHSTSNAPRVISYSPSSGQVGDFVSIIGVRFTGATSVSFNGTSAGFSVIDDATILATVPGGASTGTVSVTTPNGTGTGPSFTVTANTFVFNLDASTLPSGLTGSRTGDPMYLARSLGTAAVQETGSSIYEQRSDGSGQWTFPAYANKVSNPIDFSTGWTTNGTPGFTTGQSDPAGGNNATKITDSTGAAVAVTWSPDNGGAGYDPVASVWVRDDVSDPPTGTGIVGASEGGGGFPMVYCGFLTCDDLGAGTGWRRVHSKISTSGATQSPRILLAPSGQTPVYNAYATQTPADTGSRVFWGAQALSGPTSGQPAFDAPTLFGTTSARILSVDAGQLGNILDGNGDLDIEGRMYLPDIVGSQVNDEMRIVSLNTPSGITRLSVKSGIAFEGQFKSGSPAGQSITYGRAGQLIEWRLWYKPTESGTMGWAVRFNGAVAYSAVLGGASGSVGTPTAAYLGSKEDGSTLILPAMHTLFRASRRSLSTVYDAEGVILGDSTMAPYLGTLALVGSLFYQGAEASTRLGILSLAAAGNTAVDQLTAWQSSPARGNGNVKWVMIQIGINDILGGADLSTVTTRINNIIADVNTHNPVAKVILVPTVPFGQNYTAGQLTVQQSLNPNIAAGTGFTGSNLLYMPTWSALDDGSGSLQTQYRTGDGHNNDAARAIEASAYRAFLQSNGLL